MFRPYALIVPLILSAACSKSDSNSSDTGSNAAPDATAIVDMGTAQPDAAAPDAEPVDLGPPDTGLPACSARGPETVEVTTSDGQKLEGDLYTTGQAGGPAVVLLHMIPPSNTRQNYPANFIKALTDRGITVLNLNRRGAGGSPSLARTAYTGPDGKWDAAAGRDYLVNLSDCAVDPQRIGIVGASNGTTTAVDYTLYAHGQANLPAPKALVFLTGGRYTETNNSFGADHPILSTVPILYVFSTAERGWSVGKETGAANIWQFEELDPGDHGTRMFTANSSSINLVAEYLKNAL